MHRIDTEGNKEGQFYDGDPSGTDIENATVINAPWLNSVQEEICNVITADGTKLSKESQNQLMEAIRRYLNPAIKAVNALIVAGRYEEEIEKPKEI